MIQEDRSSQRLGEDTCMLFIRSNILKQNHPERYLLSNILGVNSAVLGSFTDGLLPLSHIHSSRVVHYGECSML